MAVDLSRKHQAFVRQPDAMSSASPVIQVPDKETHDRLIASDPPPTILYLSSSVLPACKTFTPEFEGLARMSCKFIEGRHVSEALLSARLMVSPLAKPSRSRTAEKGQLSKDFLETLTFLWLRPSS